METIYSGTVAQAVPRLLVQVLAVVAAVFSLHQVQQVLLLRLPQPVAQV